MNDFNIFKWLKEKMNTLKENKRRQKIQSNKEVNLRHENRIYQRVITEENSN